VDSLAVLSPLMLIKVETLLLKLETVLRMLLLVSAMNCSQTSFNLLSTSFLESLRCSWTPGEESSRNSSKALLPFRVSMSCLAMIQKLDIVTSLEIQPVLKE